MINPLDEINEYDKWDAPLTDYRIWLTITWYKIIYYYILILINRDACIYFCLKHKLEKNIQQ